MSSKYNKISQATKDGLDGTKHVTRLHDVPGLIRFTDKPVPVSPPKIEAMKFKSSPTRVSVDSFKENETTSTFSGSLNNVSNRRNDPKGSTDFDEEVDVNSAVRKAIEKAQESIRIAKESVGRKKKGLQSFSNKTFKDSFKVEGTSSQVFPDFKDGKKLLVVKKVIDEINEKISKKSTKECSIPVQSCNIYKHEHETLCSNEVDRETTKTETLEAAHEDQAYNMFYKGKMNQNVPQGSYQNDSEKLEEVLEQKDVQNVESDKGGEEVLELFENAKIHDEEGTCEMFCDDFEMTQEDNITDESKEETLDESFDQEFNVKSAGDDKVSEETDNIDGIYVESNIVDMYDNIVETTQDVTEDKESTEEAVASEVCEKTSMDQNESDEDEYEVKSEVNDARCVKTDMDESNKQKNIIDNLAAENDGNANEIKDSLESRYRDKEDETEEPGPSNASGQDHFRRIYEEAAAKERERVRNRSVVERAISEARERAYAEARERAERQRADVKKAIEEARQIKMAEAGEKAAKASVAKDCFCK
ncbi:auxilin-like protein 1 [Helianthus annuus]|uniref:auxilin-like protein 1 n=1 Tax=Helianthus annuus TaxID=4232 RepID=UPI0016531366|nr:auxilin-like protein 1 [Helianthus annuus]